MTSTTTIQIRVDQKTKEESSKILEEIGLDTSSAIKAFLRQVILTKGIPFPLLTENGLTLRQEREIIQAGEEAKQGINVTKPMEAKEAIAYLKSLKK